MKRLTIVIMLQTNTVFLKLNQSLITLEFIHHDVIMTVWISITLCKGKMSYSVTGSLLYSGTFESLISPGYMFVHFPVKGN